MDTPTKPNAWIDFQIRCICRGCHNQPPQELYRSCGFTKGRLLGPDDECFKTKWETAKKGDDLFDVAPVCTPEYLDAAVSKLINEKETTDVYWTCPNCGEDTNGPHICYSLEIGEKNT